MFLDFLSACLNNDYLHRWQLIVLALYSTVELASDKPMYNHPHGHRTLGRENKVALLVRTGGPLAGNHKGVGARED